MSSKRSLSRRWLIFSLILLGIAAGAGWYGTGYLGNRARQEIIKDNESNISLLSTHLTSEFKRIEGAVKSLSGSPWIAPALISGKDQDIVRANSVLDRYKSAMDVSIVYLMDSSGMTIASSNRNDINSFVGHSFQFRPYFTKAIQGAPGRFFALGVTSLTRGFYASFPVRDNTEKIIGVVVIKKDIDEIEAQMSRYQYCFFIDTHGVIFLSSKKEMILKSLWPIGQEIEKKLIVAKQFGEKPFTAVMAQEIADGMNVTLDGKNYLVSRKVIEPDGWSLVFLAPTDRILIYQSIGIIMTVLICTFIVIPLVINYKTARSAEMVRESEERFRRLADSTFEGIIIHDKGKILDFNRALLQTFGYEYDEVIGTSVMNYIAPESREIALHHMQTGYEESYEVVMQKKDGTTCTMEAYGKPIHYKGKMARVVALRDITERKRTEEALRQSNMHYRALADNSLLGVAVMDINYRIIRVNATFATMFRKPADEFVGKYCFNEFEKRPEVCPHCPGRRAMASGITEEVETQGKRDDGSLFYVKNRAVPFFGPDGTVNGFIETVEDIDKKKHAERELRESEEKYRRFFSTSMDCVFITSKDGRWIDLNEAAVELFGYANREELMQVSVPDLYINPEERIKHTSTIAEQGYTKEFPVALRKKDGTVIHTLITSTPLYDAESNVTGFQGTIRDITTRKQIEKTLQESEELYKTLAERSFAGVYVVQGGRFRFINSNAASYAGYKREELLDKESIQIVHPEDREKAGNNARAMLRGEMSTPYEFRVITKNGQIRWIMETVTYITYEGKRAILGNAMNITDRKQMEEQILAISMTDQLTGLYNRRGFLTLAKQQMKLSERTKRGLLLFFADLDGMKWINDTLGHKEGDKALFETADLLKKAFRSSDIIARMGGDEFAVLAIDTTKENSEILSGRLQSLADARNNDKNQRYKLSISVGCSYYDPEYPCSLDELMAHADKLMYEHKRSKKS